MRQSLNWECFIPIYYLEEKGLHYWQKVIERDFILEGQAFPSSKERPDLIFVAESLYHKALISQYAQSFAAALADYSKILELTNNNPDFKELTEAYPKGKRFRVKTYRV